MRLSSLHRVTESVPFSAAACRWRCCWVKTRQHALIFRFLRYGVSISASALVIFWCMCQMRSSSQECAAHSTGGNHDKAKTNLQTEDLCQADAEADHKSSK